MENRHIAFSPPDITEEEIEDVKEFKSDVPSIKNIEIIL